MYHVSPSIGKRGAGGSEFEATLVYKASFRPVKYVLRHKAKTMVMHEFIMISTVKLTFTASALKTFSELSLHKRVFSELQRWLNS